MELILNWLIIQFYKTFVTKMFYKHLLFIFP